MPAIVKLFAHGGCWGHTVDDSTNDLMDLSVLRGIGGCESRAEGRYERLLDGLEGAADSRRAAEAGAGAQDPAAKSSR